MSPQAAFVITLVALTTLFVNFGASYVEQHSKLMQRYATMTGDASTSLARKG